LWEGLPVPLWIYWSIKFALTHFAKEALVPVTKRFDDGIALWNMILSFLKPWPNGVASYRKLKTCINLWLRLAMTCVYLRWLAFTSIELKFLRKWTQVFTIWPPNACRRKLVRLLFSFVRAPVQGCTQISSPFGHPLQVCVRKFTFPHLQWLATPFGQGFISYLRLKFTTFLYLLSHRALTTSLILAVCRTSVTTNLVNMI